MCRLISLVVSRARRFAFRVTTAPFSHFRQTPTSKCSVRLINGERDANKQSGLIKVTRASNWHQLPLRGAAGAAPFCSAGRRAPGRLTAASYFISFSVALHLISASSLTR